MQQSLSEQSFQDNYKDPYLTQRYSSFVVVALVIFFGILGFTLYASTKNVFTSLTTGWRADKTYNERAPVRQLDNTDTLFNEIPQH